MKIQISNGRVIDPNSGSDTKADVFIEAAKITGIGRAPDGFKAGRTIDAVGRVDQVAVLDM